jgi:UDP:flavonoid glycosyltransferase YjiC (YdhE family)
MSKHVEWVCDGCDRTVRYENAPPSFGLPLEMDGWLMLKRLEALGYADFAQIYQTTTYYCSAACLRKALTESECQRSQ